MGEMDPLRQALHRAAMITIQPETRQRIPAILDALGIPSAFDDPALSKREYIESRLALVAERDVPDAVERALAEHGARLPAPHRFEIEELLWSVTPTVGISKRVRYDVARALDAIPLYLRPTPFLSLVARLWDRSDLFDALLMGGDGRSLLSQVERHVVRNAHDWSAEDLFEKIGALDASDRRFALFLEGLASPDVRPDEASQRQFVAAVNGAIAGSGVELREVGSEGGFPVFRFAAMGRGAGQAKNLIFASREKPDLRFRDAVNNDVEIMSRADQVLVYDLPIPTHGLRWRDLQAWWAGLYNLDDESAKRGLYKRLVSALPETSPPQTLLFRTFFVHFGARVPDLPALLPEVWLHWDPKTVRERGPEALTRYRMDFLLLLPNETRIVLEVDGLHHYADDAGAGSPNRYAVMARADRELRLAGYEVYRFGAAELEPKHGPGMVGEFFDRLFKRYGVPL